MDNNIKTDSNLIIPIKSVPNEIEENKEQLIDHLSKILNDYIKNYKTAGYHIFGIEYGAVFKENSINSSDLKKLLQKIGNSENYHAEINKGKNIYECLVTENEQPITLLKSYFNKPTAQAPSSNSFPKNSSQIIYFGAPGTGKSHLLEQQRSQYFDNAHYERVTFHPNYSYSQFVGAYKPVKKNHGWQG